MKATEIAKKLVDEKKRRYQFVPLKAVKDVVLIYDMVLDQTMAHFVHEHAQMVYLMYVNLHNRHPMAADEFMYGHILGHTLTLLHADKYPKVSAMRSEDGKVVGVTAIDPISGHEQTHPFDPKNADDKANVQELSERVRGG